MNRRSLPWRALIAVGAASCLLVLAGCSLQPTLAAGHTLISSRGGTVAGPNGSSLTVPPNTVKAATEVYIEKVKKGYDFHILGPWTGKVLVALPAEPEAKGERSLLLHREPKALVIEKASRVGAYLVAEVNSLSILDVIRCKPARLLKCILAESIEEIPMTVIEEFFPELKCSDLWSIAQHVVISGTPPDCVAGETQEQANELRRRYQQPASISTPDTSHAPPSAPKPQPRSRPLAVAPEPDATPPPAPTCQAFTVYAQNRWDQQGATIRTAPNHNSDRAYGVTGNTALSVNGWTHGSQPYPNNPAPYNSDVWYRLTDGSGWVSFDAVRGTTTEYAPDSNDGGPPAATPDECKV